MQRNSVLELIVLGIFLLIGTAVPSIVLAAPPSESLDHFTLDCGDDGSFEVGSHQGGFASPIFILNDNRVFRASSLSIEEVNNGEPIFEAKGLLKSDVEQLTCHFIGPETGRHFTVTGFFTPEGPKD